MTKDTTYVVVRKDNESFLVVDKVFTKIKDAHKILGLFAPKSESKIITLQKYINILCHHNYQDGYELGRWIRKP